MSNLQQSDLILAGRYVDGDLSAHEVTAAESRIASDADFAAAVEQIRQQSFLIKDLPGFKPADDLADRTLQASMDQVKAIMGAWPPESEQEKATPASQNSNTFDWKSAAAIAASLAGLFLLGSIIWQGQNGSESPVAVKEAPAWTPVDVPGLAMEQAPKEDYDIETLIKESSEMMAKAQAASDGAPNSEMELESQPEVASIQVPPITAFSGTPMKPPASARTDLAATNNSSALVEQIWYISQDLTASKDAVCDILQQNRIEVKLDNQRKSLPTEDAVDAFYVAATPGQMKVAMSQISNLADIEMIQLPGGSDSPIADVIQQQFKSAITSKNGQQQVDPTLPEHLQRPATNALAQQLVSNPFPRGIRPRGPVPPIMKSGTPIMGSADAGAMDLAMTPKKPNTAKRAAAAPASGNSSSGAGLGGIGAMANEAPQGIVEMPASTPARQKASPTSQQPGELDKFLDASDQQLRQYLILVRSGEEKKK